MAYDVDKQPGEWVLERTARRSRWILIGLVAGAAVTGLITALVLGHRLSAVGSLLLGALVLALRRPAEQYVDRHVRLRGLAWAEEDVGLTLNELWRESWTVMHDVEDPNGGNIDHIVSGPGGVFLVETKQRSYLDRHVPKIKRQAARLHDDLGVWVTPVLCLHQRAGKPFKTKGVWVVPRREISVGCGRSTTRRSSSSASRASPTRCNRD